MKKYLIIGLLAVMVLGMTSCSTCDCKHEPTIPCQFNKVNVDFQVPASAWAWDANNGWFSYYYETPIITPAIYDYGTWTMSHEYNPGTNNAYLIQLPEISYIPDEDASGNIIGYYSQRLDYQVGVGYVCVYVTNSDYAYLPGWTPDNMYFHMQIVY